jgi:hypothetical protein
LSSQDDRAVGVMWMGAPGEPTTVGMRTPRVEDAGDRGVETCGDAGVWGI